MSQGNSVSGKILPVAFLSRFLNPLDENKDQKIILLNSH